MAVWASRLWERSLGYSSVRRSLPHPHKFRQNQLEAVRLRGMRALILNYKCSLPGLNIHCNVAKYSNCNCSNCNSSRRLIFHLSGYYSCPAWQERGTDYLGRVVFGGRDDKGHVLGHLQVTDQFPVLLHRAQTVARLSRGGREGEGRED